MIRIENAEVIGWDVMSDHLNVRIEFSCPDYEERREKTSCWNTVNQKNN